MVQFWFPNLWLLELQAQPIGGRSTLRCAVGCRDDAARGPVRVGIAEAVLSRIYLLAETADFLAEFSGHAKELVQREAVERATGQFVFDIFLRPEQAGRVLLPGGCHGPLGGF